MRRRRCWRRAERLLLGGAADAGDAGGGLLVVAVVWRVGVPRPDARSPTWSPAPPRCWSRCRCCGAAWQSLRHPSLHGITDRLIALALVAAWASGDLMTAALLPIVMILGHVLEERSLLGSREAIRALGRLAETTARRLRADGSAEMVPTAQRCGPAT